VLVDNPDASSPRLAYCFTARGCLFGRPVAPGRRGEARRLAGPKPLLDIYISRSYISNVAAMSETELSPSRGSYGRIYSRLWSAKTVSYAKASNSATLPVK